MNVRDGQGLSVYGPRPHGHHKSDRVHQAALIKRQQLVNDVGNFDVGDLHDRRWRCKFLSMVLQYGQLCSHFVDVKHTIWHFKFCLYIVYVELTYF